MARPARVRNYRNKEKVLASNITMIRIWNLCVWITDVWFLPVLDACYEHDKCSLTCWSPMNGFHRYLKHANTGMGVYLKEGRGHYQTNLSIFCLVFIIFVFGLAQHYRDRFFWYPSKSGCYLLLNFAQSRITWFLITRSRRWGPGRLVPLL